MAKKVRPSEQKRKMVDQLINGELETDDFLTKLLQLGTEQILQETMEQERTELLERDWYERSEGAQALGYRNGYQDVSVKTTAGTLDLKKPRVRETDHPFESQVLQRLDAIDQRLAQLTIEMYTRGLSTRDIEATLVDDDGTPLVSRSSVSRITEALTAEYEDFIARDLSQYDVVYLFVDGVYEAVRSYTQNQAILAAWAICSDGTKVLLHLAAVQSESTAAWETFFEEMVKRGLRQPLFVVSDGNKGAHAAIARYCPESKRGRCIAHKLRNLSVKLPQDVHDQ
ncbi:MAG: transposase, partial [Candidatus Marinimicrobia bacterium]|nr:transposase [Candidatus Neomarinimicrobiota bacterium]MCF7830262.1 transposase [Candidatus Neomarinimicrobiota bacterium]